MPELDPRREKCLVTGSGSNVIINGDNGELRDKYLEDIGEKQPEDLRMSLPVQLGVHLGDFILDWVEMSDRYIITERQRFLLHPELPYCVTLDGYREFDDATIEAKVCNPYADLDELVAYYTPQCVMQKRIRNATRAYLAMLKGFTIHLVEVFWDEAYEREMWARLAAYALCVRTFTPPVPLPRLVPPAQWKTVNLNAEEPNWGPEMQIALETFCKTSKAAQINGIARESVKALLPDDVGNLTWNDITVKRAKNGAVSIKQEAA